PMRTISVRAMIGVLFLAIGPFSISVFAQSPVPSSAQPIAQPSVQPPAQPAMQPFTQPLSMGNWLVNLGRDYPRTPQAGLTDADAEIVLLLMQAASQVEPTLAKPFLWQFDMLSALDQPDAAMKAFGQYVERQPNDLIAYASWVSLQLESMQQAEQRAEFYQTTLKKPNLPPMVASDLHLRLAEFYHNRGQHDQAIQEAKAAVETFRLNFKARRYLETLQPQPSEQARQVIKIDNLLAELAACPNDAIFAWEVADTLYSVHLPEPADRLYVHAANILQISDPHDNLPRVLTARITTLRALGQVAEVNNQIRQASQAWKQLLERAQGSLDAVRTAEMAWFYSHFDPQPEEAEKLARIAVTQAPDLIMARRALGSALRLLKRYDEAQKELELAANEDVAAAGELALLLAATGHRDHAEKVLTLATTRPADFVGQSILEQARQELNLTTTAPATAPSASKSASDEVRQVVSRFDWAVLDYPLHPGKYLSLTLENPAGRQVTAGEPWLITAKLQNIGPFPITFGQDMMVWPDLLISVDTIGDRPRSLGPTIHLLFRTVAELKPGQTVEASETVDLGAVRAGMIGTPQTTQDVTINAVLSPVRAMTQQGQDVWIPGLGGLKAEPLRFRRVPFIPSNDNLAQLNQRLQSNDPAERIAAVKIYSMLLAEAQHIAAGRLKYAARPINVPTAQSTVLSRIDDPDWQVRANLAECLRWFELTPEVTDTALRMLNDQHWLVRGLTLRALADHHGAKFQSVLVKASQSDPDEWVRRLATALNVRIVNAAATQQAATQTATQPATQPAPMPAPVPTPPQPPTK
ncbi:MAG: HEAT repeat domain-containing protein, partial [Phycisphaerae bacterium]|nr:HEAT repeat domain-containing protein [Phycisphaerae bacterium]